MDGSHKKESFTLFLGDSIILFFALFLTLLAGYWGLPKLEVIQLHLAVFTPLFFVWILVFFLTGLYHKQTALLKKMLPYTILRAHLSNIVIAVFVFYFLPPFGIAPKTNLFLYLLISLTLLLVWHLYLFPRYGKARSENALIIGKGKELHDLEYVLRTHKSYSISPFKIVDLTETKANQTEVNKESLQEDIKKIIKEKKVSLIIADRGDSETEKLLKGTYESAFQMQPRIFIDIHELYESIFERTPLSALNDNWILNNIPLHSQKLFYDFLKRVMDIVGSLILALISVILLPFVVLLIKFEDGGSVFIRQERIGKHGETIFVYKFRTLYKNDRGGSWLSEKSGNEPTRVGKILRKTSIDELPQCLHVFLGKLSLIGPRSDIVGVYERLTKEIPYNNLRYLITPGISGWAQVSQTYEEGHVNPQSVPEMEERLAYDLFYIKNRSFFLDVIIAFKTLKALLFGRAGI